jgi:hypothetical protein
MTTTGSKHTIEDLRTHLFEALAAVKAKENPMDPKTAKAVVDLAKVIVDSAKVEVAFIKTTGALKSTNFLPDGDEVPEKQLPARPRAIAGGK